VTAEHRAALRTVAEALPAGTVVPITREQLLTLLDTNPPPITAPAKAERLLSVGEVSQRLGIGRQWVYRNGQQLGKVKIGRTVKFNERSVQRYIDRRSAGRLGAGGR
jgi:excisionase family DNA binding protein